MTDGPEKTDWVEVIVKMGAAVGLNPTRLRWKLAHWRESWGEAKGKGRAAAQHVGYRHRICRACGTLQDRDRSTCVNCGRALAPRFMEVLSRFGIVAPAFLSVSSLLTIAIVLCYLRTAAAQGGDFINMEGETLVRFGGNFTPLVQAGQWWRLSTYIFLHAGLMHIAFNLIALQQIGPSIEEVFGRGRMLFFFMLTGILAGLASELWGLHGVGIGASGSLMGLIGLAAGWGQRDGTSVGREVRDQMVKWGLYTMVFGFMIGADNAAHAGGFLSGAVLGFLSRPKWEPRRASGFDWILSLAGALAALGTVLLVLFPPDLFPFKF